MRVKFLVDFGGKLANELPYKKGDVADLGDGAAGVLVARGVARLALGSKVSEVKPVAKPKAKAKKKKK